QIKRIEQLALVLIAPPHHGPSPPSFPCEQRNHCSAANSNAFCNKIGPELTLKLIAPASAIDPSEK
ncbi:MAG: hypothetical protein Q8L53_14970, partial [Aestuariivirga sp.]|nr:hypothetical protein [Aestuariivirga sp.]